MDPTGGGRGSLRGPQSRPPRLGSQSARGVQRGVPAERLKGARGAAARAPAQPLGPSGHPILRPCWGPLHGTHSTGPLHGRPSTEPSMGRPPSEPSHWSPPIGPPPSSPCAPLHVASSMVHPPGACVTDGVGEAHGNHEDCHVVATQGLCAPRLTSPSHPLGPLLWDACCGTPAVAPLLWHPLGSLLRCCGAPPVGLPSHPMG